jgi:hypothetical protein
LHKFQNTNLNKYTFKKKKIWINMFYFIIYNLLSGQDIDNNNMHVL